MENTFYHGDCLFVLTHDISPSSIDLIYLDPPFFTGKVQKGTWQPGAMEVSYEDSKKFWSEKADVMREKAPAWLRHIALKRPDFASYLYYLMVRLDTCKKVLKNTGSIFLHCDWRASHYLKMIMDDIFNYSNFRNEIFWHYSGWNKVLTDSFESRSDNILFYARSKEQRKKFKSWTTPWASKEEYVRVRKQKIRIDENGKEYVRSDAGGGKRVKRYLEDAIKAGRPIDNVWDLDKINNSSTEATGYPTQKPESLLNRIILSTTDENDIVLDPFCGCGTCIIAAHKLNRQWIGIDINEFAYSTTKGREKQIPLGMQDNFKKARYITRDLKEIKELSPLDFEAWVNEFYRAAKPHPDKGVDGITCDGIPIQVKSFVIKYDVLDKFLTAAKYHHDVPQPLIRVMVVSQSGFDDGARKRKFEIETMENIKVELITPELMLALES
jgi:adenine specific DNA methylase Mod